LIIDILFLVFLLIAIFKGLRRGLIIAVFSLLALILGLAAAIKLSAIVAVHLKDSIHISSKWLPILAFAIVFIGVVLLVRWIAALLESVIKFALLTWIDKLGGIIFYTIIYLSIFSIILFYCTKSGIITDSVITSSKTYHFVEPFGPYVINKVAELIPAFKDMFKQLEVFFDHLT
jgi:membrane protein required for colicin V production